MEEQNVVCSWSEENLLLSASKSQKIGKAHDTGLHSCSTTSALLFIYLFYNLEELQVHF